VSVEAIRPPGDRSNRRPHGASALGIAVLLFGFAFLYAPIALLIIYSFNASRLVTVWAGFSTRWYGALVHDDQFRRAAATSLEVAAMAAGLSLLLFFVACQEWIGWPAERGVVTITIAHATFATAFVAVLVRAQLAGFDRSLEEAALDLGARPWGVLARIVLPGIRPALVSGWLLAFTLSLDDLVVASFVTGPSATTLPMAVFSSVRLGVSPEVNALASVFLAVVFVLVAAAFGLVARAERRRQPG
jgi:putrescine transport system permease protein